MQSFYPAIMTPMFMSLGPSASTKTLDKPLESTKSRKASESTEETLDTNGKTPRFRSVATRVIGSLEHPVLPMPPVCLNSFVEWMRSFS